MMMARLSERPVSRAYPNSRGSFSLIPNSRSTFWNCFCCHCLPAIMAQTTQAYVVAKQPGRWAQNMVALLSSALPHSLNLPVVLSKSPSPAFPVYSPPRHYFDVSRFNSKRVADWHMGRCISAPSPSPCPPSSPPPPPTWITRSR